MRCPHRFLAVLRANGVRRMIGVPDSLLRPLTECMPRNDASQGGSLHTITPNEGAAVGVGVGHALATGEVPMVYLQNSGLGNAVNPLLSIAHPRVYGIPLLLTIGWRGAPSQPDEPQHALQGECTPDLLDAMNIPWATLTGDEDDSTIVDGLKTAREGATPFALCVPAGTFSASGASPPDQSVDSRALTRAAVIQTLLTTLPQATHYVATTGFTGRELFQLREQRGESHEQDFLNVGGMGHASSIALGQALATESPVVCLDGDGAALMHLGAWGAIGMRAAEVPNLRHVVYHNAAHESVGGQPTGAELLDLAGIARSVGYPSVVVVENCDELRAALTSRTTGLQMIVVRGRQGCLSPLMRPTIGLREQKQRYMGGLSSQRLGGTRTSNSLASPDNPPPTPNE